MSERNIIKILSGHLLREGAGVKLQRFIGLEKENPFDPFLLLDYFDSHDPLDYMAGFPAHPHRGFETITYMLQGQMRHEDNHGHQGTIGPGDVQWMTAGKGIIHSEMPSQEQGHLQGLQLWLNLPASLKMSAPSYQEFKDEALPKMKLNSTINIKIIAGEINSYRSPITHIATHPLMLDIQFLKAGAFTVDLPSDAQCLIFLITGELTIGAQTLKARQLAQLGNGNKVCLQTDTPSQLILMAADKINEPVARLGPFVMNTPEEIHQALDDFRQHRF